MVLNLKVVMKDYSALKNAEQIIWRQNMEIPSINLREINISNLNYQVSFKSTYPEESMERLYDMALNMLVQMQEVTKKDK